jgi:transcriptional regulator with XRE-family HTH domain
MNDPTPTFDLRLAARLRALRQARGWSLDRLAELAGVSRPTLSRLETGEVSGTASVLNRLCAAHGLTLSRLMGMVEGEFPPHVPAASQDVWVDPSAGYTRRVVSPPSPALKGEAIQGVIAPGQTIAYDRPPRPGLEHHLVMLSGRLTVTVDGVAHAIEAGDALRYVLHGESRFQTPAETGATYLLFLV